jgi:hypothetical protein
MTSVSDIVIYREKGRVDVWGGGEGEGGRVSEGGGRSNPRHFQWLGSREGGRGRRGGGRGVGREGERGGGLCIYKSQ